MGQAAPRRRGVKTKGRRWRARRPGWITKAIGGALITKQLGDTPPYGGYRGCPRRPETDVLGEEEHGVHPCLA
jgi:hypothetical protein